MNRISGRIGQFKNNKFGVATSALFVVTVVLGIVVTNVSVPTETKSQAAEPASASAVPKFVGADAKQLKQSRRQAINFLRTSQADPVPPRARAPGATVRQRD